MCPRHIQRYGRVVDPYGFYIHTFDGNGRYITGHYRCDLCTQQVVQMYQPYFHRLRLMAIAGVLLGVVGLLALLAYNVDSSFAPTDQVGQQLTSLLWHVGCVGGPGLVVGAGFLYYRRYRQYP
jgi:hypothetical protein